MTPKVELSNNQQEIVYADSGAIYVKASAGSGKTRVLTERVRYLLDKTNKKVLALTFTNKAGEEIKERLNDISDIEKRVFVGTFHSFCQSILESHGNLIGLPKMPHIFEDEADRLELVEQALEQTPSYASEYKNQDNKERKKFRYRVLSFVSKVKRDLIADSDIEKHTDDENIVLLYRNYQDILRAQNAIDFDDLLLLAHSLLINFPKTAALYRRSFYAICIDEAQDLNNAQYHFLLALANSEFSNIMMVGDPNQSIYHFNGSSPDYMDKMFIKDFHPFTKTLTENYRSSKTVLAAAKKVIPEAEGISGTVKEGVFEVHRLDDENDEAQWVTNKISELLTMKHHDDIEGEITCEKFAVLARNKYIFGKLESKLIESNLPFHYRMTLGSIKFESDLMKIFDLALRVKLNSQDILHKQRLLSLLTLRASESSTLEAIAELVKENQNKNVIKMVIDLHDEGNNLKKILEKFRDNLCIEDENEKTWCLMILMSYWCIGLTMQKKLTINLYTNSRTLWPWGKRTH